MSLELLQNLWYLVLCVSVVMYTILDGFDLGVGALHLFAKNDRDRRIFLNAIGPVWDGNEVWLVVIGGALLAGFPGAYATIFSGFYTLFMLFLAGIIFRAVAIEFRSKKPSPRWRHTWDVFFSVASIVIAIGIGMILGCLIQGIPLDAQGEFIGTFSDFIDLYTITIGLLSLTLCTMHGVIFLLMKTEGDTHDHVRKFMKPTTFLFVLFYALATLLTFQRAPYMIDRMRENPWLFIFPALTLLCILNIVREVYKGHDGHAFISSSVAIALLFSLFGIGTYPILVRSTVETAAHSLTLYNCSSTALTLKILLIIVLIGVPLVFAYGFWIYRIFRGKVKLDETSY